MERLYLQIMMIWLLALPLDGGVEISVTFSTILLGSTTVIKDVTETPQRMKFIFSISYETIRRSINTNFLEELGKSLATMLVVAPDRISEVVVTPGPNERAVVDFKLSSGGTVYTTIQKALDGFNAGDVSKQYLSVGGFELTPLFLYCNWTDGQCPKDNDCVERCSERPNLYPLLVLLLIPVIIVVVIVLLWYFKYRKVGEKSRIDLTELGYVENRSKFGGTLANRKGTISGISLADNGVRNEVYTTMGRKYGFSIDNADFSDDVKEDYLDPNSEELKDHSSTKSTKTNVPSRENYYNVEQTTHGGYEVN